MTDAEQAALRKWQASFERSADDTLFAFERVTDLLTDQVKVRGGVTHLRSNFVRFREALQKLKDIEVDMVQCELAKTAEIYHEGKSK